MKTIIGTSLLMMTTAAILLYVGENVGVTSVPQTDYRPYISTRLAIAILDEEQAPEPNTPVSRCDGSGWITHGDGHKTRCPGCSACEGQKTAPEATAAPKATEAPKASENAPKGPTEAPKGPTEAPKANPVKQYFTSIGLESIPTVRNYRPIVGVSGMTVRQHLERGALGNHSPVPAVVLNSLTVNQMYWLHDYLHGYRGAPAPQQAVGVLAPKYEVYHFGALWCFPCKRLKQVWADPSVAAKLSELDAGLVILDADNQNHQPLFAQFKISTYPTVIFLSDNKVLYRFSGAVGVKDMLRILEEKLN
jgi:thiol-disulfide isomerase/thioredoxin